MVEDSNRDDNSSKPDELPPWEIVEPSDWLCKPYFNAEGSEWVSKIQKIIDDGKAQRNKPKKLLTPHDVERLKYSLAKYIQIRVTWDGFLTASDRDSIKEIQAQFQKCFDKLEAVQQPGNNWKEGFGWYFELAVEESPEACSYEEFLGVLKYLANFEVRSPRLEKDGERKKKDGERKKMWSPVELGARAKLQDEVDRWWHEVAGLPKAKAYAKAPAFGEFLKAMFLPICLPMPPGYSETAIAKARKEVRKRESEVRSRLSELGSKLIKLEREQDSSRERDC